MTSKTPSFVVLASVLVLPLLVSTSPAETLAGYPEILDGDTLRFAGAERVRLAGVDAPEGSQFCAKASGLVRCEASQRGRYGRWIAVCFNAAGENVAGRLVAQGWALAYRRYSYKYVSQEHAARKARRGLWRGRFIKPWEWRRGLRLR